ncbi:MAG: hypothetical protein V1652_00195 [bacterium]
MKLSFLKEKFFQNSVIYTVGAFLGGLFNYGFHFFVSRRLSVAQYGELQTLMSLFALLGIVTSALSFFVIKHVSAFAADKNYHATSNFIHWLNKAIAKKMFFILAVLICIAPFIQFFLKLSDFWGIAIVELTIFFTVITVVYLGALNGWERFFTTSSLGVGNFFLKMVVGACLVLFFPKASIVAFAILIPSVLMWFAVRWWSAVYFGHPSTEGNGSKKWEEYFSFDALKKSILPIFIFSSLMIVLGDIDVAFVKSLTNAELTGYFGALKILGKIILTVNLAVVGVLLPRACADEHRGTGTSKKIIGGAYGIIFLSSAIATISYALFPKLIINILFGEKYVIFSNLLWLYGVMAFVFSILTLEAYLAYARHTYTVSYILGGVVLLMWGSVFFFSKSLFQITVGLIITFTLGYVGVLALNLSNKRKRIQGKDIPQIPQELLS